MALKRIGRSVTKNCTDTTENHAVPSRQFIVEDKKFSGISALELTSIQQLRLREDAENTNNESIL